MKNNQTLHILILVPLFLLSFACASPEAIDACVDPTDERGFLFGLIHGFLAPLTFIIGLFTDDVTMYAVNNSGGWYDFGFLLGIGGFSGGIFRSSRRKK